METQLSRKYRSKNVQDIVGNATTVMSLKTICHKKYKGERLPQAYLIEGILGCGKTTIARIIPKIYNCLNPTPEGPCNECENCNSINSFIETGEPVFEVKEVDATKDDSKNDMDRILDECMYPSYADYTVLIIDEAHMAKDAAQQRLLKVLEEPPKHLVIILCTTEVDKIRDTIKSRCSQQYHIRQPSSKEVVDRLAFICESEGISFNRKALAMIARANNNILRSCINNLERVADERGVVDVEDVEAILELVNEDKLFNVFSMLNNRKLYDYLAWVHSLHNHGEYFTYLANMFKTGLYAINNAIPDLTKSELETFKEMFKFVSTERFIQTFYMISEVNQLRLSNELKLIIFGLKYMGYTVDEPEITLNKAEVTSENNLSVNNYKQKHEKKSEDESSLTKLVSIEDLNMIFGNIKPIEDSEDSE